MDSSSIAEHRNYIIFGVTIVLISLAISICVASRGVKSVLITDSKACSLDTGWYYYDADGGTHEIKELPAKIPTKTKKARIYRQFSAKDFLDCSSYICLYSHHQNICLRLNGEVLYNYSLKNPLPWLKSYRAFYHFVKIPDGAEGILSYETETLISKKGGEFREILIGEQFQILKTLLYERCYKLIMGIVMALLGLFISGTGALFFRQQKKDFSALTFGALAFLIGLWQIEESRMMQFFVGQEAIHFSIEYLVQPIILLVAFLFIHSITPTSWSRGKELIIVIDLQAIMLITVLQLLGITHYSRTLFIVRALYLLDCVYIVYIVNKRIDGLSSAVKKVFTIAMLFSSVLFVLVIVGVVGKQYIDMVLTVGMVIVFISLAFIVYSRMMAIFESVKKAETYREMAYKDVNTNVYSRTAYFSFIDSFLPEEPAKQYCLILFDMNNLKLLNDTYGHRNGDKVISAFGNALKKSYGQMGNIYRIGGDEFVFLGKGLEESDSARLTEQFNYLVKNQTETVMRFTAAMGQTFFTPLKPQDFYAAQDIADTKMYENKRRMKLDQL